MTDKQMKEEIEKCRTDMYYFFSTYWVDADGRKPTLTREMFEERMKWLLSDEATYKRRSGLL